MKYALDTNSLVKNPIVQTSVAYAIIINVVIGEGYGSKSSRDEV